MNEPLPRSERARRASRRTAALGVLLLALAHAGAHAAGITLSAGETASDLARLGVTSRTPVLPREERLLLRSIEDIAHARLDDAQRNLGTLLSLHPDFHLARVVLADVLMARSGRFVDFAAGSAGERVDMLRDEAKARLANARHGADPARLPEALLQLSASQRSAVVVDVAASRLYLYVNEGTGPRLLRSVYASTGKNGALKHREGDQRTPLGVYFVAGRINGDSLPDFYGPGALPVNYPNEWDLRHGRTGYGIWIHGVPGDTFARAPRASDGCIAVSNPYVAELLALPQPRDTPVIIGNGLRWVDAAELSVRSREFAARVDAWRRDWESRDVDRYARHYSRDFRSDDETLDSWMRHKRRINAGKSFIRVRLDDVSMFAYPGERDLVVVTFDQDYTSSNFANRSRKRQYWQRESDGRWRIVYEGSAKLRSEQLRGIPYSARIYLSER